MKRPMRRGEAKRSPPQQSQTLKTKKKGLITKKNREKTKKGKKKDKSKTERGRSTRRFFKVQTRLTKSSNVKEKHRTGRERGETEKP